jgi:predicted Zn-dependent protease
LITTSTVELCYFIFLFIHSNPITVFIVHAEPSLKIKLQRMKTQLIRIFSLLFMITLMYSCSRNPVTGKREIMLMSEGQESAMGAQYDPSVIASYGLYDDKVIQDFINEKGKEMGAISHRPDLDYQFRVLDSPVINAFAVPGGYVYFTRGILAHFSNEAEFMGVLGHEIGHVTARHSAKQYSKSMLAQVGMMAGVVFSEDFRNFADAASQGIGVLFLKYSRDNESESDKLGVVYSTEVGYDSHKMADFFKTLSRLSEASGQSLPDFLSTHPNPANRYTDVNQMTEKLQSATKNQAFIVNRDKYLRMIDGLVYGEDPRQGFTENNRFYHPELKFQFPYPNGWRLANSPSQVQIAPTDGKALIIFSLAQGASLDEAAQTEVQNAKLQVVESNRVNVNGADAIAMISDQTPTDEAGQATGDPIRILTYFIQRDNIIYKIHGMSLRTDFNSYYNSFQQTAKGFNGLTDPSKLNVKPERVKIVSASSNTTLRNALTSNGMPSDRLEEISILNGMELTDQLTKGMLFKVVDTQARSTSTNNTPATTPSTGRALEKEDNKSSKKPRRIGG